MNLESGLKAKVNPGALDKKVTLNVESTSVSNEYNEEVVTYATVNVMGNFQYMSGKEVTDGGKETTYLRGRLVIRDYPGLTVRDFVTIDSKDWDIETIGNYGRSGMYNVIYLRYKE